VLNVRNNDVFSEVKKLVLGEKFSEEKGKAIGMSIKSIGLEGAHMEQTFTSVVKGFGRFPSGTNLGTLDVIQASDGGFSGSGQGIFTSQDGDTVTWKLYFFGRLEQDKNRAFGIAKFWTASQRLAWMNKTIAAFESIADPKTMELSATGYEWK
jgi:hypothetical protein